MQYTDTLSTCISSIIIGVYSDPYSSIGATLVLTVLCGIGAYIFEFNIGIYSDPYSSIGATLVFTVLYGDVSFIHVFISILSYMYYNEFPLVSTTHVTDRDLSCVVSSLVQLMCDSHYSTITGQNVQQWDIPLLVEVDQ